MKPKSKFFSFLFVAGSSLLAVSPLHAATYYWDTDGVSLGSGSATPDGSWVTNGTTWSTSPNGTAATSALTTNADDDLVLSAGTDATGSYTVTLGDSQLAKSLTFRSGTATISGAGGVINLGGTGIIRVNSGPTTTPLSAVIGNASNTIISGSAGLTKTGVGTLTLDGSSPHTFTGGLNVNGGTLALSFSNLTTPTNFIDSSNALSFGGGALTITGKDPGDTAQTFGNLTVNSGGGDFRVNPNNGTSTTVTLGSLTTTASGGSLIIGQALSSGTGTLAITTTTNKDATGIYGGRVVFANGTADTGYDWATTDSTNPGPYALSAYAEYTPLELTEGTDTANSLIDASATMTGSRATNSLKFAPFATAQTLINTGFTLNLTSGGLLFTGASVAQGPRITGGSITAGDGTAPADLVVHSYNATTQGINIATTGGSLDLVTRIDSNIVDNGGNAVTLVKAGPGDLYLKGTANTFSGGIVINGGRIGFSTNMPSTAAITANANSTLYTPGTSSAGSITLNNGSQLLILNNNSSFSVSGNVTGTGGGISLANGGQGAITVNLNGLGNTFTGPIRFLANNGTQAATINLASFVDTDTLGTGNITFGGGTASSISHNFTVSASATDPVTLNNRRFEMAGLNVNQQINNNSAQTLTINNDLLVTGSNGKNIQFGGSGNISFAGAIGNHPTPTAPGTIPNAVRKSANSTTNTTLTLASVEGIEVGVTITGATLTAGTTITAINPLTREVTLSNTYTSGNNSNYNVGVIFTIPNVINSVTLTKTGTGTLTLSNENSTYTGVTLISQGILEVTKLADTGVDSSIGRGGSGSSAIGLGSEATLRYTGSTTSSTNRALGSTTTGNNTGFVLESAGVGPVQFTNTSVLVAGSNNQGRYYTLTGDNTGNNILAAQINNNGTSTDNTNIIKNGTGKWVLTNPNSSFTGAVFINNGTISTDSIKNSTVASPIGAGLRFTLGNGDNNGTLEYTGAGDSSNRETRVGTPSTIPGTGGGAILNNGSGALTFTASNFNIVQSGITDTRTLTLGGDYTGSSNDIQGVVQDNTASTGVVNIAKTGDGTWKLSGANTYTGTTAINGGTLIITGATQATSAITFGGGVLGLDVASPVTAANATVNFTGQQVLVTGTPTLASYTLLTASSIVGTPTLAAAVPGYELSADGTTLKLNAIAGPGGYATWSGGAAADLDSNNDGVDNGVAWVLGAADPNAVATGWLPTLDNTSDPDFFIFTYRRSDEANADVNTAIKVEYCSDLASWTDATPGADIIITPTDDFYNASPDGVDKVEVKIRRTLAVGGKLFTRLNVVVSP